MPDTSMLLARLAFSDEQRRAVAGTARAADARPLLREFHESAMAALTPLLDELCKAGDVREWGSSWRTGEVAILVPGTSRESVIARLKETGRVDSVEIAPPLHGRGRRR